MKYLTCLFLVICFFEVEAQLIPANLKLDISTGNHFNHSQLTEGHTIKSSALHNLMAGFSYAFKPNLSFRSELSMDMNRPNSGSAYFKNDYFRTSFGVSADLLQIRFSQSGEFKNAARLWQDKFKVHGFLGIGVGAMVNKVKFDREYDKTIFLYDYMFNVVGSIMPTYYFNRYTAVFARLAMIGHIKQAYKFDMMDYNPNPSFDGGFMNFGIGISFTPFKSNVGARTNN
ncbi:MAG: hypothetical protein ACK478_10930 [Flavobacteriales bacterium]|jgi:hypothetical protein